jgi:hypothetical protein
VETYVVQFPSRAFTHIAPPWAQALHASPAQGARVRSSHPSDDLMLTESDLEALAHPAHINEADPHGAHARAR